MQLLFLLTAYAYDSQHVFYTLRVKKVTTKSNTQRLLPIKWILRDIISNQIKSIYCQNTNIKMLDKVTYSELLFSDN